eukprot:882470-Prymnesium_polylepis.1
MHGTARVRRLPLRGRVAVRPERSCDHARCRPHGGREAGGAEPAASTDQQLAERRASQVNTGGVRTENMVRDLC